MLMPYLHSFNLKEWTEMKKGEWGERAIWVIWESPHYIALIGRGPTKGRDFHVGPSDEIFYQLEGELHFHYITPEGERKIMMVHPGETFLLPAKIPHAPRRPDENSWTLVVERKRGSKDMDYWIWFCERCNNKLHETIPRTGVGPSNTPNTVIQEASKLLRANEKLRTCTKCGDVLSFPSQMQLQPN
jgi:3-hydroxyanthranilate 3,4-dioxygenase